MVRFLGFAVLLCCALAMPAQARWRMAESENFVVYADDSAEDIQRFSQMLERYHSGMEVLTGRTVEPPSSSNRLTIFAVGDQRDIARLVGNRNTSIAGFYVPRASGSIAFVQNVRPSSGELDFSMTVLLHEYAHHFFAVTSTFALPRWMSEGGAEYFASAQFPRSGDLQMGMPAQHRSFDLFYASPTPIRQLLDFEQGGSALRLDAFYGRSWLLFHYLMMDASRQGQINRYWEDIRNNAVPLEAAERVFGDLDQLESDLDDYLDQRRINTWTLPASMLTVGPVTVRGLSEGMNAVLPLIIQSKRGVTREQALELLPEIQEAARDHPADAGVLSALAEAEFDAGNNAAAIAAADRAIAIDPSLANPYVQKGYALFQQAAEAGTEADYGAAMAPFQALNRIEPDHTGPLIHFYQSFAVRGREPSELARHALERASQLAPFDMGLRMQMVWMLAQEGQIGLAQTALQPLLANPHNGEMTQIATVIAAQLSNAEEGVPLELIPPVQVELNLGGDGAEED